MALTTRRKGGGAQHPLNEYNNFRDLANAVKMPTLITRGDSRTDQVHPLADAFEMFNLIDTSHLWIKPEGGCLATPEGYDRIRAHVEAASAK